MNKNIKLNPDKEMKLYFLGFLFSIILTVIPFVFILKKVFSTNINYFIIVFFAVTQIVVHCIYFLHLSFSPKDRWNLAIFIFTIIIILIILFGSIWIMNSLNHHIT